MNAKKQSQKFRDQRGRSVGWFTVTASVIGALLLGGILFAVVAPRFGRDASLPPPEPPANIDELDKSVSELIRQQLRSGQARQWDAAAFGELGLVYEANQLWQNGYDAFRSAVQLSPQDKGWRLHLAICAHEIGDFEVETTEIQSLTAAFPNFAPALHRYGQQLMEAGTLVEAATTFTRVIELEPSAAEGYVGLAEVRLRQGESKTALSLLERALEIDEGYKVAHFLLGSAYRELGREQEAERHLRKGMGGTVRHLPDAHAKRMAQYAVNLKARTTAAVEQMVAGKTEPATRTFEEALQADPKNVTAMNNLAGNYVRQNRIEEAEQLLQRALKLDPEKYSTHVNLANIAVLKKQYDKALALTTRAVELEPGVVLTHRSRASVLFRLGRFQEAYDSAAAAARLNPGDLGAQLQCADLALRLKDSEAAVRHFGHVLEEEPNHIDALIGLVRAHWARGDRISAQKMLSRAATLAPQDKRVKILSKKIGSR